VALSGQEAGTSFYWRDNERDAAIAKVLTKDEAWRIAANIAKLLQPLKR
jgi:hypothetical protein